MNDFHGVFLRTSRHFPGQEKESVRMKVTIFDETLPP